MKPFGLKAIFFGTAIATALSTRGVRRKSLSVSGAFAAWAVGFLSAACGLRGFVLLIFYQIGTWATKYGKTTKQKKDAAALESAVRGAKQVLACSAIAVACSMIQAYWYGEEQSIDFVKAPVPSKLTCAILAHHATCLADTLASELGILASQTPILITAPWRRVPPGTNGAITVSGTCWSAIGGVLMGLSMVLMDIITGLEVRVLTTALYGIVCGVVGSTLDSALGATLQASYYDIHTNLAHCGKRDGLVPSNAMRHISGFDILSNAQVNLVSILITTTLGGLVIGPYMFGNAQ